MYWICNQNVFDSPVCVFKMYSPTLMIPIHSSCSLKSVQKPPSPSTTIRVPHFAHRSPHLAHPFLSDSEPILEQRHHILLHRQPLLQRPLPAWNAESMPQAIPCGSLHETSAAWPATRQAQTCLLPECTNLSVAGSTPFNINQLTLSMSSLLAKHARMWQSSKYVNISYMTLLYLPQTSVDWVSDVKNLRN